MTNPHPLTEGLISALEHIAGEERPGHHSLCDCPACVANDALSRHADRLSAQPSTEAVKLADELALLVEGARKTDDDIAYYSGSSTRNPSKERLAEWAMQNAPAILAILSTLRQSPPLPSIDETYAEWQQKRGRAADLIDWAINEFDGWMMDDHYDARVPLDRIIDRFREYRNETLSSLMRVDAPKGLDDG